MTATVGLPANPHGEVREAWLAINAEAALEPALPIVDAHHHLWDRSHYRYEAPEMEADIATGHSIRATVHIECASHYWPAQAPVMQPVGETEYIAGVAADKASSSRLCAAIMGNADLALGRSVRPVLEAHIRAGGGRFRGIRSVAAWNKDPLIKGSVFNPPPHLLAKGSFREGVAELAELGLIFEVWLFHTQLQDIESIADAFPNMPIVVDHMGGPLGVGSYAHEPNRVFDDWRQALQRLAQRPNIYMKLSGLGMRVFGHRFDTRPVPPTSIELAEAWAPWFETGLALFGARRCLLASNFPVDKTSYAYGTVWNAFKRLTARLDSTARASLFHDNAIKLYRLQV